MGTVRKLALAVLGVLVVASVVFGLRSWVGLDPAGDLAAPNGARTPSPAVSPTTATPEPTTEPTTEPTPTAAPSPEPTTAPRMSTANAAAFVKNRLDAKGRATSVVCPPSVPAFVGSKFTCSVAYTSAPGRVVADATVTVTGPGGSVRFVSVSR